jgi:putative 3-deoxy-D-arabino-heptulosonate 7-phosphate synthase|nr:MAG TPA: hypothetical protein [Caudoviricetes sp.]
MQYYKDKQNQIYAYDDDASEIYIKDGLTKITEDEAKSLLNNSFTIEQYKEGKLAELNGWYKNMSDNLKVNIKDFGVVDGSYKALSRIQAIIDTSDDLAVRTFVMNDGSLKKIGGVEDIKKIKKAIQRATAGLGALKMTYEIKINKAKTKEDLEKITYADTIQETL